MAGVGGGVCSIESNWLSMFELCASVDCTGEVLELICLFECVQTKKEFKKLIVTLTSDLGVCVIGTNGLKTSPCEELELLDDVSDVNNDTSGKSAGGAEDEGAARMGSSSRNGFELTAFGNTCGLVLLKFSDACCELFDRGALFAETIDDDVFSPIVKSDRSIRSVESAIML